MTRKDGSQHVLELTSNEAKVMFKLYSRLGYQGLWFMDDELPAPEPTSYSLQPLLP